jgi:hemolysin activation/secretion protein
MRIISVGTWVVMLVFSLQSMSASYAQIPGPLEPTRPSQDLEPQPTPRATPTPPVPLTNDQLAPDRAAAIQLVLNGIRVEGAQALRIDDLRDLWTKYIGSTVTVATLFDIVNGITRRYAEAGYALSLAVLPEQRITDGVVTVRVIEGYVDDVIFTGDVLESLWGTNTAGRNQYLDRFAKGIKESRPLKTRDLERYLLLINDLPGVIARATFAASATTPGASTATIEVARKPVNGQGGYNNHMVPSLGRSRVGLVAALNGQFDGGDRLRAEAWRGTVGDSYVYVSTDYSQMVGGDGFRIGVLAAYSNSRPVDGLLADLNYVGRQVSLGFRAEYPIIRSRQMNLFAGGTFDYSNAQSLLLNTPFSEDRTRTLGINTTYDIADATGAVSLIRVGLAQGLNILNATQNTDPLRSRAKGSAVFTNLEVRIMRDQPLFDGFSVFTQAMAQVAMAAPLLSASECSYGGRWFGRAYYSGTLSGDDCIMGNVELRWTRGFEDFAVQLYGFGDAAGITRKGALQPGETYARSAASWGGGIRLSKGSMLWGELELAVPVDWRFANAGSSAPLVFVSLAARF